MIEAYLARIGLASPPVPTIKGLEQLQGAHTRSIGFENLDVRLGRRIRIDSDAVFDKLVRRRRGGYCFEQNRLFSDALAALGFVNRPILARGLLNEPAGTTPPLTHMAVLVDMDGESWLLDAGFGGLYIAPVPVKDGAVTRSGHRLRRIGEPSSRASEWVLEFSASALSAAPAADAITDWQPQYSFDLSLVAQADLEQANHWTSTRPDTRFTTGHVVSISRLDGFAALTDRQLSIYGPNGRDVRQIEDAADYAATVRSIFRIALNDTDAAALPLFANA